MTTGPLGLLIQDRQEDQEHGIARATAAAAATATTRDA